MDATLPYRHNLPKPVSAGNYETVNAGNYEMGKDTSSWAALFTVPIHSFVLEVVMKTVMETKESAAKIKG